MCPPHRTGLPGRGRGVAGDRGGACQRGAGRQGACAGDWSRPVGGRRLLRAPQEDIGTASCSCCGPRGPSPSSWTPRTFLIRATYPEFGWRTVAGEDPAPTCTWSPSKAGRLSRKPYMAPNLSRSFKGGSLTNWDYGEGGCKRRNLGTMLALPVDERRENDDCHGSV